MSKKIPAEIQCPSCQSKFNVELYRSVWLEDSKNRELIFNNELNAVTCPSCKKKTHLKFPFICTNVKKEIAVWYEPYHDADIDKDIALYKAKMGSNSFYANAPRIQDWEEFKQKIIELENKNREDNKVKLPEDMEASFSGFINHLGKESKKRKWLQFRKHISTIKGRFLYSFLPFLLILMAVFADKGTRVLTEMQRNWDEYLIVVIIFHAGSFAILTLLNWAMTNAAKDWGASKDLRLWVFGSSFWLVGVLLYVIVIEPYDYGSLSDMSAEEYFHMFLVMLVPPIFIGTAKCIYEKYIK